MILVLDVGNTQIACGLYQQEEMVASFRHSSAAHTSSDEIGVFLCAAIKENGFDRNDVRAIAISSVVPHIMYALRSAAAKYFGLTPFVLTTDVTTGLDLHLSNPRRLWTDCVAGAIAGVHNFPDTNLILIDLGTANTVCAVTKDKSFLGGMIMPGFRMTAEILKNNTSKLPLVEIVQPEGPITTHTTETAIQNGLYYGTLDALKGAALRIGRESFGDDPYITIGTGGFARMFADEQLFEHLMPDMVLEGTYLAWEMNQNEEESTLYDASDDFFRRTA